MNNIQRGPEKWNFMMKKILFLMFAGSAALASAGGFHFKHSKTMSPVKAGLFILFLCAATPLYSATVKQVPDRDNSFLPAAAAESSVWIPWKTGFQKSGEEFICDNGIDTKAQRGIGKIIALNQKTVCPIRISAESRAENVEEGNDGDYSLYLDITFTDGSREWGIKAPFSAGTHSWETREITYLPPRPVRSIDCWLLLRNRAGKSAFRNLQIAQAPSFSRCELFDSVPVRNKRTVNGWILRDVKNQSDFVTPENGLALGMTVTAGDSETGGAVFHTLELSAPGLKEDRILHIAYVQTLPEEDWSWMTWNGDRLGNGTAEYSFSRFTGCGAGGNGYLPLAAVGSGYTGHAVALDLNTPAHGRAVYNSGTRELFAAFDIALTPEHNHTVLKAVSFDFRNTCGLRSAFARLYGIYPDAFQVRIKKQGLWMPFAEISRIPDFEDFGFAVKEGTSETAKDDACGILTFRYTEPMTWWMPMPSGMPRTTDAAVEEALRLEREGKTQSACAFSSSVYLDHRGKPVVRFRNTPWCDGAVWSMNSMPDIPGEHTDFKNKWNQELYRELYTSENNGILDGEYIDSSEGYVTAVLDYNRKHFNSAQTPLTYDSASLAPGIFRGLVAYEYARAIADDVHRGGKLTMANSTPLSLWYLAPLLDCMGTEADWNRGNRWSPPSDNELLCRRALCAGKPYCFLQNTDFTCFDRSLVERYMKYALFYGMYPGFFSADASTGHYFKNPSLYNRDRDLFKKYVPLCKLAGEAGWRPETMAHSDHPHLRIEQFGDRYFTFLNDTGERISAAVTFSLPCAAALDHISGQRFQVKNNTADITLPPRDVLLLEIIPAAAGTEPPSE